MQNWNPLYGYGIRGLGERRAYVWGNRGVRIKTSDGEVFLGHSNPDRIVHDLDVIKQSVVSFIAVLASLEEAICSIYRRGWKFGSMRRLGVLALLMIMGMFARLYRKAGPHEALIIYGSAVPVSSRDMAQLLFPCSSLPRTYPAADVV